MSEAASDKQWYRTFDESLWLKSASADRKPEAEFLAEALELEAGDELLDAPCGAGGVSIHLARKGVSVTGVDLVAGHIRRARKAFAAEDLQAEWCCMDLREMGFEGRFDAAMNWFGSFGYFSEDENRALVGSYARSLKAGGRLVIDQPNRERILRSFRPVMTHGSIRVDARWSPPRCVASWTGTEGGREVRSESSIRLYTPKEFGRLIEWAGLELIDLYGDWQGGRYRRGSQRTVVLARKPG